MSEVFRFCDKGKICHKLMTEKIIILSFVNGFVTFVGVCCNVWLVFCLKLSLIGIKAGLNDEIPFGLVEESC